MVDFDSKCERYGCRWLKTTELIRRFEVEAIFTLACTQNPEDALDWDDDQHHAYDYECSCTESLHRLKTHSFLLGVRVLNEYSMERAIMRHFDFDLNWGDVGWIEGEYPWPCRACNHHVVVRDVRILWAQETPWKRHPHEFIRFT